MICNITTQEAERLSYISGDTATARALGVVDDAERKMIDADADCSDVLMQVVSDRRALKSFSEEVLESHMQTCIENAAGQSESEGRENVRSLLTVLQRYVA